MNAPLSSSTRGGPLPLPGKQFQRFIVVFHFIFLLGLAFTLYNRLQRVGFSLGPGELIISLLVVAQMLIYVEFFVLPLSTPRIVEWWGLYFPVSFSLWFITWQLEPSFEWVVLGYLGQMFGAIPPRYSLSGGAAVFLVYLPAKIGWPGIAKLTIREWLAYGSLVVGWTALGLFLHRLVTTSAERAKLIEELEKAKTELELARERDLELAGLRERERLAREMHDSLGHGLVTLTVQLEAAQRLYPSDPQRASEMMNQMKELTRSSTAQLRRSLAGLRSPGLGDRRLLEALEGLCQEIGTRSKLRLRCEIAVVAESLKPALAETLWRVAQEGLVNVEKHAQATSANLKLEFIPTTESNPETGEVLLRVLDDGVGIAPDAESKPGHYGLRGLRERVEACGGSLTMKANGSKGTLLEARVPCPTALRKN